MAPEENRISLYSMAGMLWMMLSHKYASLGFKRLYPLMRESLSMFREKMNSLDTIECLNREKLHTKGYLKERHWKSAVFMAVATSLPLLYRGITHTEMVEAICAKASIGASAKLMDNLNDEHHSYEDALMSLSVYESALGRGRYEEDLCPGMAERSACEIAGWACKIMSLKDNTAFHNDVALLVSGQVASLQHKKDEYPSMKEYLSRICERSIGNVWIDMDLTVLNNQEHQIKEGNDYIFKSYLIYDDVQDIARDLKNNSVNAAVILGLERGILEQSEVEYNPDILENLEKSGIFRDLLWLGDLVFLKGLELISEETNPVDRRGLAASLGLIRMFNIRRILRREMNVNNFSIFLAGRKKLRKMKETAPEYLREMVEFIHEKGFKSLEQGRA
ncbi:MAG: hypothetical protein HXS44_15785 [Theionarchaea archaeon]|nr:hypothetical protein [Theionarchaea archaeon]